MIKISLENDLIRINLRDIEHLINRLPLRDRIKLVTKLRKEAWAKRLDEITQNIRARRKKHKMTDSEIAQEIETARNEFHARHH